jgi:hypothetical protein
MSGFAQNAENSFGAFSKASDLKKRILYTLLILIIYRFGTYMSHLPGIDPNLFKRNTRRKSKKLTGNVQCFCWWSEFKEWLYLHWALCHIFLLQLSFSY